MQDVIVIEAGRRYFAVDLLFDWFERSFQQPDQ